MTGSRSPGCIGPVLAIFCAALLGALLGVMAVRSAPVTPQHAVIAAACPPATASTTAPALTEIVVHAPDGEEAVTRSADELVRAAVGRWVGEDGTIVEMDPPKPLAGKAPPYKLVVRGTQLPKGGYGCEFANGEIKHGPGDLTFYRAWCSAKTHSTLGLGLGPSGLLSIVVISDGDVKVHTDRLRKAAP